MKKTFLIASCLFVFMLTSATPSAAHVRFGFGAVVTPPVIWTPPPAHYPGYYAPYPPPGYGYYAPPYRVRVPGYWDWRWTPYGWRRIRVPGYWDYR